MLKFLGTKIGISIILAVLIIGGATVFKFKTPKTDNISSKIDLIADASVQNALKNGQLDNPDWENTLKNLAIGTTTEEIIKNLEQKASANTSEKPLTATDRFAREFLTQYVKLKESGTPIDENTGLSLVNKLLATDYGGPAGEKVYTESDVSVINTTSLTEIKKYGNTLGTIFNEPTSSGYENELVIVNRVYETEKNEDLQKLALNIARYEKIRDNIAFVAVPTVLKNAHISLLNSLSAMIEGVRGMSILATDPVGATKMVLRYEDGLKSLELSTRAMSAYFKKQNVIFSSTEPGYIFVE
ncbi:MAG: hypothetical protein Q7R72_00230 [bacterium]|nr:hypothetical protein [bacterium]